MRWSFYQCMHNFFRWFSGEGGWPRRERLIFLLLIARCQSGRLSRPSIHISTSSSHICLIGAVMCAARSMPPATPFPTMYSGKALSLGGKPPRRRLKQRFLALCHAHRRIPSRMEHAHQCGIPHAQ